MFYMRAAVIDIRLQFAPRIASPTAPDNMVILPARALSARAVCTTCVCRRDIENVILPIIIMMIIIIRTAEQ